MIHDATNRLFSAILIDSKKKGLKCSGRNHNACLKERSSTNYQLSEEKKGFSRYTECHHGLT